MVVVGIIQVIIADEIKRGKYIISFDPLNGSSQIDSTAPMVWEKLTDGMTAATNDDFMQPGSNVIFYTSVPWRLPVIVFMVHQQC
ncbi:hypothetical protein COOONC_05548 [Cooperia oncophora]